jgi:5-keto-L-gluconate epimerase
MRRIYIGGDHVSLFLKEAVILLLKGWGETVVDVGPYTSDVIVDYNDYAQKVAFKVAANNGDLGIVICGTGLGVSIAANKVKGVRAALCHDVYTAHQSRAHNDANILAMGAWIVSPERMPGIVGEWLNTPFEGGRHIPRIQALDRFMSEKSNISNYPIALNNFQFAIALSTQVTSFGPVLYSGRVSEGFAALHDTGFKYVELSMRNSDDLPIEEIDSLLEKYQLKVSAIATGQGCIHDQLCLSNPDPTMHQKAMERLYRIIDLAHHLDTKVILGGVKGMLNGSEKDRDTQKELILEGVRNCCKYAEPLGVGLLIEAINRYETNFINTATEALAFVEKVGDSKLKVLLDTFHMNIEEVDIPTSLRLTGERLGYIHLVDSNRLSPGQGHICLDNVLKTLDEIGYRGVVSAEILPLPDDASAVQRTANFLASIGARLGKNK